MYIIEAFRMAILAIWAHKLRSALTLVGIIAGVASIIGVMTGISVIQTTMEKEMSVLGATTFQVQKWGAGPTTAEERREIRKRRPLTVEHADAIRENIETVNLVGAELWGYNRTAQYQNIKTNNNLVMCGGTKEYAPNNTHNIALGRNLTDEDVRIGRSVVVLGNSVAGELFPWTDPIHKTIKIDGRKFEVIGTFSEKKSAMGGSYDNYLLIPITRFKRIYGKYRDDGITLNSVNITVNAISPDQLDKAIDDTRLLMRQLRGLKPNQKDDFTIFSNKSNIETFNKTTAGIKTGAFLIGIVALIVAGIGIMNIMLVSVTERTSEIGLRKALGATRKNIMTQFLLEAIMLCNIGGIIGVAAGFGLGNLVTIFTGFDTNIPIGWLFGGLTFCTTVGIVFGSWPAMIASKLDPIKSLRYE